MFALVITALSVLAAVTLAGYWHAVAVVVQQRHDIELLTRGLDQWIVGYEMLHASASGHSDLSDEQLTDFLDDINRNAVVALATVREEDVPDPVSGPVNRYGERMQS